MGLGPRAARHGPDRPPRRLGVGALLGLVLALAADASRSAQPPPSPPAPPPASGGESSTTPTAAAPIPIERIAPAAAQAAARLRTLSAELAPSSELDSIRGSLERMQSDLKAALERTRKLLQGDPSLEEIQAGNEVWSRRELLLGSWLDIATARAAGLQKGISELESLRETWSATQRVAAADDYPALLKRQIYDIIAALDAMLPALRAKRDAALDAQAQIGEGIARCESARTLIGEAQQGAVGGILARDGRPLWDLRLWTQGLEGLALRATQVAEGYTADIRLYLQDPSRQLPAHLALFALTLIALVAVSRQADCPSGEHPSRRRLASATRRPLSAALLVTLFAATGYWSPAPAGVKATLGALAIIPTIVLVRPLAEPPLRPALYTLGLLMALDAVRSAFGGDPPLVGQVILLAESLAGSLAILGLLRYLYRRTDVWGIRLWRLLAWAALLTLVLGLLASLLGYLRLARLTSPAVVMGGGTALGLLAALEVAMAVIGFLLQVWPLKGLRMVAAHRGRLLTRTRRLLLLGAALGWLFRYLDYLGLWVPARDLATALLAAPLRLGSFSLSLGELLAFATTIAAAYWLSKGLRFVLEEELYPRVGVAAGTSYAASSLLSYLIWMAAFFVALGFLGISLNQVTVFAGALGVGVGLGLQNVVHNFVSGLILLFEQPIQVGDAVQVGSLQGRVRRIGIRASVIRTFDGAEVIIPNSDLTANQVTNWTLTDAERRIEVPVVLPYGTDPDRVIPLLMDVARNHPKVLAHPEPSCLFTGYGDSSENFEVRAWTYFTDATTVKSELTARIYEAVNRAGLGFPSPQREERPFTDPPTQPAPNGGSEA